MMMMVMMRSYWLLLLLMFVVTTVTETAGNRNEVSKRKYEVSLITLLYIELTQSFTAFL